METPLTPHKLHLFSQILWQLGSGQGSRALRKETLENVCALLQADYAASCIIKGKTDKNGLTAEATSKKPGEFILTLIPAGEL
ncbi:hypothetical protein [Leclercia tamurae]|uniref:hypothetical protein n=1 Tax=Leclercia tamurae TaxID=2926467 RepID=UPI0036F460A7